MIDLIVRNAKFAFILLWILCLPVIINLDYLLNLWLNEVPKNTYEFCLLALAHALITSFRRPFIVAVQSTGEIKSVSIQTGIIMCSVIPISFILFSLEFRNYATDSSYFYSTCLLFNRIRAAAKFDSNKNEDFNKNCI